GIRLGYTIRALQVNRYPHTGHPDVCTVRQPVVVSNQPEALLAPFLTPGILKPEAILIVSDECKGMRPANLLPFVWDITLLPQISKPAIVYAAGCKEHTDLRQCRMNVHDIFMVNPVIGP